MLIRICRTAAVTAACLLAAVGAVVLAAVAPVALVGVLALGATVGVVVATHLRAADAPVAPRFRRLHAAQRGTAAATATVAALLTMTGVAAVLGAAAGPVILLLLLGAVVAAWRHRNTWPASATPAAAVPLAPRPTGTTRGTAAPPEPRPVAPPVALGTLTIPALCLAWHRSYWLLRELPPGSAHTELTTTRERLLDELERRDPAGFRRWLHGGARASSDPRPYLTEHPTETDRITPTP